MMRPPRLPRLSLRSRQILALLTLLTVALVSFARGWFIGVGIACLLACLVAPDGPDDGRP